MNKSKGKISKNNQKGGREKAASRRQQNLSGRNQHSSSGKMAVAEGVRESRTKMSAAKSSGKPTADPEKFIAPKGRWIAVIGGGAAGMMAAAAAAAKGAPVVVFESGKIPGKKILATGNGRCNFTNRDMRPEHFRAGSDYAYQIIESFDEKETEAWFRSIGLPSADRDGYLYPRSMQATALRDALEEECRRLGVVFVTNTRITEITPAEERFLLSLEIHAADDPDNILRSHAKASKVILTCGGKASPVTGSDGSGLLMANQLGHDLVRPVPALVPLISKDKICQLWQGVRVKGKVELVLHGERIAGDSGELQLTKNGISGIPVFQVSRYASYALAKKQEIYARLDFSGHDGRSIFRKDLLSAVSGDRSFTLFNYLHGRLPDRLCNAVLKRLGMEGTRLLSSLTQEEVENLVETVTTFRIEISDTAGFAQAQVTAGGVSMRKIRAASLESRICPGLYFAGEIMDVDGICGGYNLQWAWSSGHKAGVSAAEAILADC